MLFNLLGSSSLHSTICLPMNFCSFSSPCCRCRQCVVCCCWCVALMHSLRCTLSYSALTAIDALSLVHWLWGIVFSVSILFWGTGLVINAGADIETLSSVYWSGSSFHDVLPFDLEALSLMDQSLNSIVVALVHCQSNEFK